MRRGKGFTPLEGPRLAGTQIRIPNRQSGRFLAGFVRRNLSNRAAFTLIELLVVISILVLLMAILLPTLRRARNQARAIACQSNLRQWGTILALYVEDNQGRLPRTPASWFIGASLLGEYEPRLKGRDIKDILCCPSAVKHRETLDPNDRPYYDYTFRAWEARYFRLTFHGSYGFNEWLLLAGTRVLSERSLSSFL